MKHINHSDRTSLNAILGQSEQAILELRLSFMQELFDLSRQTTALTDDLLNLEALMALKAAGDWIGDKFVLTDKIGTSPSRHGDVWRIKGVSGKQICVEHHYSDDEQHYGTMFLDQWPNSKLKKI